MGDRPFEPSLHDQHRISAALGFERDRSNFAVVVGLESLNDRFNQFGLPAVEAVKREHSELVTDSQQFPNCFAIRSDFGDAIVGLPSEEVFAPLESGHRPINDIRGYL